MADMNITGNVNVDLTKWKKLTPQEILREQGKGEEEIPAEIVAWAQQMAAFAKIPDDVTYERVDGDVGIDALDKLGIEDEEPPVGQPQNAQEGVEPEEPDAVREPGQTEEDQPPEEEVIPGNASDIRPNDENEDVDNPENDDFSLADTDLTTDPNEIRKRKERKGIQ